MQNGTISNPWQINTIEDLQNIGYANDPNKRWSGTNTKYQNWQLNHHYIIMNDIDATGFNFKPIGYHSTMGSFIIFNGFLYGQGYKIVNLNINLINHDYIGLFAYNNGMIQDIHLIDCSIKGHSYTGAIAGRNNNNIRYSSVNGNIDAFLTAGDFIGGLTGINYGNINYCYFNGNVSNERSYQGGITGYNQGVISYSYSQGHIHGRWYTGGFCGYNVGNISYSYSTAYITNISTLYFGGFAGGIDTLSGYSDFRNYWDRDSSTVTTSPMATGRSTAQMKNINTYTNWYIKSYVEYPIVFNYMNSATFNTVLDTTKTWKIDEFYNYMICLTNGLGQRQRNTVISNSIDTLFTSSNWRIIPDNQTQYLLSTPYIIKNNEYPQLFYQIDKAFIEKQLIDIDIQSAGNIYASTILQGITDINVDIDFDLISLINLIAIDNIAVDLKLIIPFIKQPAQAVVKSTKTKAVVR